MRVIRRSEGCPTSGLKMWRKSHPSTGLSQRRPPLSPTPPAVTYTSATGYAPPLTPSPPKSPATTSPMATATLRRRLATRAGGNSRPYKCWRLDSSQRRKPAFSPGWLSAEPPGGTTCRMCGCLPSDGADALATDFGTPVESGSAQYVVTATRRLCAVPESWRRLRKRRERTRPGGGARSGFADFLAGGAGWCCGPGGEGRSVRPDSGGGGGGRRLRRARRCPFRRRS